MQRERIRKIFSFYLALASILALWVNMKAGGGVGDPDVWFHMRNAEYLLTHHSLPRFDTFSYTTLGHPWMDHEWLAEIPYYLAWRAGGLVGIYAFFISLLEVILLGTFYWAYKSSGNLKASFLVCCFCVWLAAVSFGPRTLLFGYFYLLILLLVLWRYRTSGQAPLWILPVVFCLWINSHGSWLIGMIVFGIFIASGLVEGNWGRMEAVRWSSQQLRRLLAILGASVAAVFVNPFGYRLVFYPFDLAFRQKLTVGHVEEWASVDFHDARGKIVLFLLVALLVGTLLARCRWKLEELGLTLFALYSGLTYVRFLFLAAILLAPLLAKFLDFLPPYRPEIDKPLLNALIFAGILIIMAARFPSRAQLENDLVKTYPAGALAFAKSRGLPGHVFNWYSWGGYITWHRPELKTFIDGRSDIYEYSGVFQDYLNAINLNDSLRILDKYQIRYVLFPPKNALSYMLLHQQDWKVLFKDDVSILLERVGSLPGQTTAKTVWEIPKTS